ncbi:MAG: rRNA maturation RNase YbeY, partial [Janthinobacterium lividum]
MDILIEISKQEKNWNGYKFINKNLFKKITTNILERFQYFEKIAKVELSILLTNDHTINKLNKDFRKKNKPTNILSFPDTQLNWQDMLAFGPNLNYMYLGDIAFSYETIMNESLSQGKI